MRYAEKRSVISQRMLGPGRRCLITEETNHPDHHMRMPDRS